ncbi:lectin-like domain-containing protein [Lactiplantibacillus daowaiensis]|uniref:Cell surface protein n=1 Tax=Lactiplantibacillus daowaiensis TaxID=2559918 RepID=A0ABW1S2T0_9LACO|nr:cell surface protein [Lactiplantibacillus daowaiensis]
MRKGYQLLLAGMILVAGLWTLIPRALAADAAAAATPVSTAPKGLNQLDKLFELPTTFSNEVANSANIQTVTNSDAPHTEAIEINNAKKQLGGAWSKDANRIDLNEDTTLKMWLYHGTSSNKAGDGLAFVMQNDPNGTSAAASYTKKTIVGETMGVWGVDNDTKQQDTSVIASTAIQNSWALEFDTYANTSTSFSDAGSGTSFDAGIKGQHIATGYPGAASQYTSASVSSILSLGLVTRYYFTQLHQNATPNLSMTDGQWHHLTMKWDASAKTMTYLYNDINQDGSENASPITHTQAIDTSKFNTEDGKVRWGIMGTNGSNAGNSLVVFESIPNLLTAEADVAVTDTTKNKPVTDGVKVKGNDSLKYDYTLTYKEGQQDWANVEAAIKLPQNVTFKTAEISYANGTSQTLTIPDGSPTTLDFELEQALSADNPTATITLKGTADDVEVNSQTTATKATFTSNNFETDTTAPDYTITVDQGIEVYFLKGTQTVTNGDDAKITGLVLAEDSVQLSNSKITVYPTLNGTKLDSFKMSDDDESGLFSMTLKADQLKVGKNTLTVYVMDEDENESEEATAIITVKSGELGFKSVATNSNFATVTLDGQAQTADRADDWDLVVADDRGKGSSWQLQASATKFTNEDGREVRGQLIYKKDGSTTAIGTDGVLIDSHESTSDTDDYDVTKQWNTSTGMFFETNAGAVPGDYSGTVTWTLSNAPS